MFRRAYFWMWRARIFMNPDLIESAPRAVVDDCYRWIFGVDKAEYKRRALVILRNAGYVSAQR